jgi:hypothetical protein
LKIKIPAYKSQIVSHNLAKQQTLFQVQGARNYVSLGLNILDSLTPSMYHRTRLLDVSYLNHPADFFVLRRRTIE